MTSMAHRANHGTTNPLNLPPLSWRRRITVAWRTLRTGEHTVANAYHNGMLNGLAAGRRDTWNTIRDANMTVVPNTPTAGANPVPPLTLLPGGAL